MKMDLVLELMDVPGQLVSVLDPISGLGANLVTVIHKRDSKNEKGMIPVQLTLEVNVISLTGLLKGSKSWEFQLLQWMESLKRKL